MGRGGCMWCWWRMGRRSGFSSEQTRDGLYLVQPRQGGGASPADHLSQHPEVIIKRLTEDRFVMRDAVSQPTDMRQVLIRVAAHDLDGRCRRYPRKHRMQVRLPQAGVLPSSKQLLPECEMQLSDHFPRCVVRPCNGRMVCLCVVLIRMFRSRKAANEALRPWPRRAVHPFQRLCDAIAKRNLNTDATERRMPPTPRSSIGTTTRRGRRHSTWRQDRFRSVARR